MQKSFTLALLQPYTPEDWEVARQLIGHWVVAKDGTEGRCTDVALWTSAGGAASIRILLEVDRPRELFWMKGVSELAESLKGIVGRAEQESEAW